MDSHEAIVVYRRTNGEVSRRVEQGPALFVPLEDEWLHEFRWHGADPKNPQHKIPRGLRFTKLRVIPDQTYHLVDDVRTSDDALLTVKLMIFFELADVKLTREAARAEQRQSMETQQTEHAVRLKRLEHDEQLRRQEAEQQAASDAIRRANEIEREHQRESHLVELEYQRATDEQRAGYLATMREMQVDLTRYLVAQYQNPDRLIRISGDNGAQLHLHEDN